MANRSDRTSIFPRRYKRMLALDRYSTEEQRSVIRKVIIDAHAHGERVHKDMLAGKIPHTLAKASEIVAD